MITDVVELTRRRWRWPSAQEKKRIPSLTARRPRRLPMRIAPYTVHYTYDTYALANGTGKAIVKQGGNTWFFLTADYAFGHRWRRIPRMSSKPTAARSSARCAIH